MKKLLLIFVLLSATVISSFANDFKTNASNGRPFTRPWTVSSYGFLVFPTVKDLGDYIDFVKTKTHSEIQQYITDSLSGFSSRGSSIYSNDDVTVTESEATDYAMNTYRIIQTAGVVLRPVSPRECSVNFEFVLTMTPAYLNSTTYGYLQSGTYDQYSMNKFATNSDAETSIVDYCALTPYGHEETEPSACPDWPAPIAKNGIYDYNSNSKFVNTESALAYSGPMSYESETKNEMFFVRPFWGWGSCTCTECDQWGYQNCGRWYYVFWIRVSWDPHDHVPCGYCDSN